MNPFYKDYKPTDADLKLLVDLKLLKAKRNKVYLSGKITGLKIEDAQKLFEDAEREMDKYYDVVNPMKLPHDHDHTWEGYMREDLQAMLQCQFICMLPNWEESKGARIEKDLAETLMMPVIYLSTF